MMRIALLLGSLLAAVTVTLGSQPGQDEKVPGLRPSGIAVAEDGSFLLVGNLHDQSLIVVDLSKDAEESRKLKFVGPIVDLVHLHTNRFAAVHAEKRELVIFQCDGSKVEDCVHLSLDIDPVRVSVSLDGEHLCVTGLWSRAVQSVRFVESESPDVLPPISLKYEPQEIVAIDEATFLIADAFAGNLSVLDAANQTIISEHQLNGHGIRGLALSRDGLHVRITHQRLNRLARTELDDIHWGSLLQNLASQMTTEALLDRKIDRIRAVKMCQLGDVGNGFADPTAIVDLGPLQVVASGGANQLAIVRGKEVIGRVDVGERPTQVLRVSDTQLVVLNAHGATISDVTIETDESNEEAPSVEVRSIGLGGVSGVTPGERDFYSARLSHQSWLTCNSCHVDGHTSGDLADTLGDGGFGNAKRIPSLLGRAQTAPFGWLGNKPDLHQQIAATLENTMRGPESFTQTIPGLVRFLESLPSPTRKPILSSAQDRKAGEALFAELNCIRCHTPPLYTSPKSQDVAVRDELGNSLFNPPSLIGLGSRRRFFHDGRFDDLSQILSTENHQVTRRLSAEEKTQFLAFLRSL